MNYDSLSAVENLWITKKRVAGDLASWAVQQSPYDVPDALSEALVKFQAAWPGDEFGMRQWPSMDALEKVIFETFETVPEILAWNERKNGREGPGFSSRYDQPSPDDDFIDLHALARNVAMSVWADAVDFKKFNDDFDARHAPAQDGAA